MRPPGGVLTGAEVRELRSWALAGTIVAGADEARGVTGARERRERLKRCADALEGADNGLRLEVLPDDADWRRREHDLDRTEGER